MAQNGNWRVVGKTNTKKSQFISKQKKKAMFVRMPKISPNDPLEVDSSIYETFMESEKINVVDDDGSGGNVMSRPVITNVMSRPAVTNVKKNKSEQNARLRNVQCNITLESALSQICEAELVSVLKQSQLCFPGNEDVWLKDLASIINLRLEHIADVDPVFKDKLKGFPHNQLSPGCRHIVNGILRKCSKKSLDNVFHHCLKSVISDAGRGMSSLGYKIFLQMMAIFKPSVTLGNSVQYLEIIKSSMNRPSQCLSILWTLGQSGIVDLRCGLRVWIDYMMPCLGVRSVTHYPVEYLENLFLWHKDLSLAYGAVTLREYFHFLDMTFSMEFNLPAGLRNRLQAVFPQFKSIAYGSNSCGTLQDFFASYLRRAEPENCAGLKKEVLRSLLFCLQTDRHCWSTWCQLYTKHLSQSAVLLHELADHWEELSNADRLVLKETLRSFSLTNDTIIGRKSFRCHEDLNTCSIVIQELQMKMNESHFPWNWVLFILSSIMLAVVAYDFSSSPTIQGTGTVRFLEHSGLSSVWQHAWGRLLALSQTAVRWADANMPLYFHWLEQMLEPVWQKTQARLNNSLTYVIETWSPFYRAASMTVESQLVARIQQVMDTLESWFLWSCLFLGDYLHWAWKYVWHWSTSLHHWVHHHFIPTILSLDQWQTTSLWCLHQLHNYTLPVLAWCNRTMVYLSA